MTFFGKTLLITGSESMLAERAVDERRAGALREAPHAEVRKVDAGQLMDVPLQEVLGGSLFATEIIAIIDDIGACPADVVDALVSAAGAPPAETCLILVHHGGNKGKRLLDQLRKQKVERIEAKPLKAWEAWRFVVEEAKRHGLSMQRDTAEVLVGAVGTDLRALAGAVTQLASDADDGVIDEPLIRRYFAGRAEVSGFNVADALLAGSPTRVLEQLRWALDTGVAPVLIVAAVANNVRALGKYLEAQGNRMSQAELAAMVGVPPFKLRSLSEFSRHWSVGGMAAAVQIVAQADADVKGAATNPDHALEKMALAILSHRLR